MFNSLLQHLPQYTLLILGTYYGSDSALSATDGSCSRQVALLHHKVGARSQMESDPDGIRLLERGFQRIMKGLLQGWGMWYAVL